METQLLIQTELPNELIGQLAMLHHQSEGVSSSCLDGFSVLVIEEAFHLAVSRIGYADFRKRPQEAHVCEDMIRLQHFADCREPRHHGVVPVDAHFHQRGMRLDRLAEQNDVVVHQSAVVHIELGECGGAANALRDLGDKQTVTVAQRQKAQRLRLLQERGNICGSYP